MQLVYFGGDLFLGHAKFFALYVQLFRWQLAIWSGKEDSCDLAVPCDDYWVLGTYNVSRPVSKFANCVEFHAPILAS